MASPSVVGWSRTQHERPVLTRARVAAFADAVAGAPLGAACAVWRADAVPPQATLPFAAGALTAPLLDPTVDVDLIRLLLVELALRCDAPAPVGAPVFAAGRVAAVAPAALGQHVVIDVDVDVGAVRVLRASHTFLARAPRRRDDIEGAAWRAEIDARRAQMAAWFIDELILPDDAPARFAAACEDHDPLHTDADIAENANLPAPLLAPQGTLAIALEAVQRRAPDDPCVTRSVRARFGHPVLGGDRLRVTAHRGDASAVVVVDNQLGARVLDAAVVLS